MKTFSVILIMVLWPVLTMSQSCGDADGSGDVTTKDLALLCAHLTLIPGPAIFGASDVDGKQGLTIADMTRLNQYLRGAAALECSGSQSYSIQESLVDTIFVEFQMGIPTSHDQVLLHVRYAVDTGASAMYLPIIDQDPQSPSAYELVGVDYKFTREGIGSYRWLDAIEDTVIFAFTGDSTFSGSDTVFSLKYIRTGSTGDQIQPLVVDRDSLLRPIVERNGELFHPVIQYVERPVLPDSIWITPSIVHLIAASNSFPIRKPTITVYGSNSHVGALVSTESAPAWQLAVPYPLPFYPSRQIDIDAYADGLAEGSYSGDLVLRSVTTNLTGKVRVNLRVMQDPHYPIADFNCDGIVDVNDLARMISLLAAGVPLPPSCN